MSAYDIRRSCIIDSNNRGASSPAFCNIRCIRCIAFRKSKLVLRSSKSIAMGSVRECICAIDQGTQSTRVYLFDKEANVLGSHQAEFTQYTPHAGWDLVPDHNWTEHDPVEIYEGVQECIDGALRDAKNSGHEPQVIGIGITNQRETTVVWDKHSGKPFHRAIVWHDSRTSNICHRLKDKLGSVDYFRDVTGLPISPYFSAYKYRWLIENVEEVQRAVKEENCLLGTIDTWLIWNLTGGTEGGVLVTDISNASRTGLMDLRSRQWHEPTLKIFEIEGKMLADIKSNAEVYGQVKGGPLNGVQIAGCIGDQQAALLGQSCQKGEAKNTYGTGCFLLLHTGETCVPSAHGLLSTVAYQLGSKEPVHFALEGSIAVGGVGVRWLRDNLGCIDSAQASEELASSVPDTAGVFFVPAFGGLLAPHWQDDARGIILGLTSYSTKAHIVRAMLEAIAWQTKEILDAMKEDNNDKSIEVLKVDGGASQNKLLMQIQADLLQIPVQRPKMLETTSLGAAYAAGVGTGFWEIEWVLRDLASENEGFTMFKPEANADEIQRRYQKWQKAVSRSFDLADLAE